MKKFLMASFICFFHQFYGVSFFLYSDTCKKDITFEDGTSFDDFEKNFRSKHKDLYIPGIKIAKVPEPYYVPKLNFILVPIDDIDNQKDLDIQWTLLHESGHAQNSYESYQRVGASVYSGLIAANFWGKYKLRPYKNMFTKLTSKSLAGGIIASMVNSGLSVFIEKRADDFANKHADKDVLYEAIKSFESFKKELKEEILHNFPLKNVFIDNKLVHGIFTGHPTLDSRIANIKVALKDRFNVEL